MTKLTDNELMRRAIELASRGRGFVEPNPMVGCVIAREGEILGEGWHLRFGSPHAEVAALKAVTASLAGATMFVNLEPCCHHGKTPPCTDAILASEIRRVIIASRDPHPRVDGQGIDRLVAAGVQVQAGLCEAEALRLNAPFFKRMRTGKPWVIAKWAMTLDGKIATSTGDSKWISGEDSRAIVHQLRGMVDAVVVGRGTVVHDDPLLTPRPPGPRVPCRVIMTATADVALDSQLVKTAREVPVLIATGSPSDNGHRQRLVDAGCEVLCLGESTDRISASALLDELGRRGMTNVLVEGGSQVLGAFLDEKCIDEVHVFVAPMIVGGRDATTPIAGGGCLQMNQALRLVDTSVHMREKDTHIHGFVMA